VPHPLAGAPSDKVTDGLGVLIDVIVRLDARVTALEGRPQLRHAGVWRESVGYPENVFVTDRGGLWSRCSRGSGDRSLRCRGTGQRPAEITPAGLCVRL
jgi:hypothetical protein